MDEKMHILLIKQKQILALANIYVATGRKQEFLICKKRFGSPIPSMITELLLFAHHRKFQKGLHIHKEVKVRIHADVK